MHLFPEISGKKRVLAIDCNPDNRTKIENKIWKSALQIRRVNQVAITSRHSLFIFSCPN